MGPAGLGAYNRRMTRGAGAALSTRLCGALSTRLPPAAAEWLGAAVRRADGSMAGLFAAASKRVGRRPLALSAAEAAAVAELGLDWPTRRWAVDDAARAALLLSASERLAEARFAVLVCDLYRHGDAREQAAIVRALELLPHPASWLSLARQAARGAVPEVVAALARDNPYPARHFPGAALEHLAREAAALGLSRDDIWGLDQRLASRRAAALEPS